MGFVLKYYFYLLSMIVLLPALCYSQDTFTYSRATYYGSPDCLGTPTGACGFGEYGRTVNDANVAGVSRLWKNGTGCGACYQVRCKVPQLCTDDGVNVVVTDYGEGDNTDFILSPRAYSSMAKPDTSEQLFSYGVVGVEFRRIPCRYYGYNLMFKVHEHSKFPDYLAIVILYQAGQNDVLAVEIWQEYCKDWVPMRRAYGAVFDIANPPRESISLRFQVRGSMGETWVVANNAIPSDWKAGVAYDSQIQLN
ncbi:Expansin-like like [Melia azedarach]|uniref:Expansin-like like n=1 Tax=Melia azedarach TaxID=155640 RepID=A0ACC1XMA6_MELAZ|nr:Expansin-like like [Melia azedarach]